MKRVLTTIAMASALISFLAASCSEPKANNTDNNTFTAECNPLFRDAFTADPAPLVWNDTLYLYAGHDEYYDGQDTAKGGKEFNITEWLCYSTADMKTWRRHGAVLRPSAFQWADTVDYGVGVAWASQVVERNGKFYYYTAVKAGGEYNGYAIGVAVGDKPTGPFKDAIGKPLVHDKMTPNGERGWWNDIDPTVLIDGDDAWMCWGNGTCFIAKLDSSMTAIDGEISVIDVPRFIEGPWLHKHNGKYYLTYASHGNMAEAISYATADTISGTWTPQGQVTGEATNSFTIHPGIAEFKGKWYLFYHNATLSLDGKSGAIGRRSVCVDTMEYNEDGTIKPVTQTKCK